MSLYSGLGANSDHRPNDIHLPRTQREAGIDLKKWESRLSPMRSWCQEILRAVGLIALVLMLWALLVAAS